jgi:hypothetical protein
MGEWKIYQNVITSKAGSCKLHSRNGTNAESVSFPKEKKNTC